MSGIPNKNHEQKIKNLLKKTWNDPQCEYIGRNAYCTYYIKAEEDTLTCIIFGTKTLRPMLKGV